jgi:hypothetical protein
LVSDRWGLGFDHSDIVASPYVALLLFYKGIGDPLEGLRLFLVGVDRRIKLALLRLTQSRSIARVLNVKY